MYKLIVPTLLLLIFLTPAYAASSITLNFKGNVSYEPLETSHGGADSSSLLVIPDYSMVNGSSVQIGPNNGWSAAFARARTEFREECWIRYNFKCVLDSNAQAESHSVFMGISFHDRMNKDQPGSYMTFSLKTTNSVDTAIWGSRIIFSADTQQHKKINRAVDLSAQHCVEAHFKFSGEDSVYSELFLDSDLIYSGKTVYLFTKNHIMLDLVAGKGITYIKNLKISGFEISDTRPYPLPEPPVNCSSATAGSNLELYCAPDKSALLNQEIVSTRWVLSPVDTMNRPLFDYETKDLSSLYKEKIPFELDKGVYVWKAFFRNRYGNLSGSSAVCTVNISSDRAKPFSVKSVYLTKKGRSDPVSVIVPGKDYELHVEMSAENGWRMMGYIIASLSHQEYTSGHPGNKGGKFIPDSNYTINLSFDYTKPDGRYTLFEKHKNAIQSRRLNNNESGLYLEAPLSGVKIDTAKGRFVVSFKLLPDVKIGNWVLSVYHVSGREEISNVYRAQFSVALTEKERSYSWIYFVVSGAILAALFAAFRYRKGRVVESTAVIDEWEAKMFNRMNEYIKAHLSEDISQDDIRKELGVGIHKIHKILKTHGFSTIPQLINRLRMDAAKELLKNTNKNITEVAFAVGFKDSRYFAKVFKEFEGLLPTEFKKKN
ncbi:MAG: helix-turn-helix transcriptional regulator [Fibrobacteres bacterium]|nr:helix-turn-helix transcriptional regulator [Fibrobacterota bacterium]